LGIVSASPPASDAPENTPKCVLGEINYFFLAYCLREPARRAKIRYENGHARGCAQATPPKKSAMHDSLEPTLDVRLLRVLHMLLSSGSVSRTAALLGHSQPSVSANLKRLRNIFDDLLLVRSGGHMVITERGASLLPVVGRILEDIGSLVDPVSQFEPARSRRQLRIVAASCFAPFFLPRLSELILRKAPGIKIDYCSLCAEAELMHDLETGEIDLVIGNFPALPERLRFAPLLTTDIVCLVRVGHPLAGRATLDMKTYLTQDHISPTPWSVAAWSPIDGKLRELHLQRRLAVSVPEYTIAPSVLARTDLVFTTGRPFAEHLASSMPLSLMKAPPELGCMQFHMLWHERSHVSLCSQWLRGLVRTVAEEIKGFKTPGRERHRSRTPVLAPAQGR
jgi:DNA-binding transcriptional LysR family regulator